MLALFTIVVLNFLGTWGPLAYHYWKHKALPITVTPAQLPKSGPNTCELCSEPARPVRTHDGKWRCFAHKNS